MNVMVVEDDPTDRKLMTAVLRTGGHHVCEQRSAEHVFEAILAEPPDLILLDLKLPGMDGLTLLRHLKQDERTRRIPIVAVTAAGEQFPREDALHAGCDLYITKPVDTRKLPEQVAAVAMHPGPRR